jgi:transcriptional regulator of acetoin/glycerol metabolism
VYAHGEEFFITGCKESPVEKEKQMIAKMLTLQFPRGHIAQRLGMSRTTLYRKMKKYGF